MSLKDLFTNVANGVEDSAKETTAAIEKEAETIKEKAHEFGRRPEPPKDENGNPIKPPKGMKPPKGWPPKGERPEPPKDENGNPIKPPEGMKPPFEEKKPE